VPHIKSQDCGITKPLHGAAPERLCMKDTKHSHTRNTSKEELRKPPELYQYTKHSGQVSCIIYCTLFHFAPIRHKSKVALHASCSMQQLQKTPAIMADKSRSDSFKSVSHYGRGVGVLYGLHHGCRFCWASRCNYMLLLINSSDKICIHELGINPQNLKNSSVVSAPDTLCLKDTNWNCSYT
jgi:hypothetical protein